MTSEAFKSPTPQYITLNVCIRFENDSTIIDLLDSVGGFFKRDEKRVHFKAVKNV